MFKEVNQFPSRVLLFEYNSASHTQACKSLSRLILQLAFSGFAYLHHVVP